MDAAWFLIAAELVAACAILVWIGRVIWRVFGPFSKIWSAFTLGSLLFIAGETHQGHSVSTFVWSTGLCVVAGSVIWAVRGRA